MGAWETLALAVRLARRELSGGVRGMRVVIACLALGVAAIAGVATLRKGIELGLDQDGQRILGGDLELSVGYRPLEDEQLRLLNAMAEVSRIVEMRGMAVVAGRGQPALDAVPDRMLVELKAVDGTYPLYGEVAVEGGRSLADALGQADGRFGVVAEAAVVERLGLRPGDRLRLGEAEFAFRGTLLVEPDRVATPQVLGPRVMIAEAALPTTRLIQPGSLVRFDYRLRLPEGSDPRVVAETIRGFGDGGWRIRDTNAAAPQVGGIVERTALFMTLVGLTALLVGGIGVANGVKAWIERRQRSIAVLKCVGAPAGLVFTTYGLQIAAIASLGIVLGVVGGAALPHLGILVLGDALPVPPVLGIYPRPLLGAALYGVLVTAAFALWPLARARSIPGAALFREGVDSTRVKVPVWLWVLNGAAIVALVAVLVVTSRDRVFTAAFCGGAFGTLLLFRLGAWGLSSVARRLGHLRNPAVRLGLASLYRPGSTAPLMLVSLGLGLSTLAAVALIQGNLQRQVLESIPERAPAFFFIDIQPDQVAEFDRLVRTTPGTGEEVRVPSLRARIVALNGVPVEQAVVEPDVAWALRGDRGLTYAASAPANARLVEGAWWPADYRGEPLLSFDANLAKGMGIGVGSTMTVNVLGRDVTFRVANLRQIDWRSLSMNFTLVASPGLLESAPHTFIATVHAEPSAETPLLRAVTDAMPNVSAIRVRDALATVNGLLEKIAGALSSTAAITLVSGALVLAGAIAATQARRIYEGVVLKTLGATRRQVLTAYLVEFGALGLTAGLIASVVGSASSWAVTVLVLQSDWALLPGRLAMTLLGCTLLVLAFGWVGTAGALRAKAAPLLRAE